MSLSAFYERKIVPHVLDLVMRPLARCRHPTLARAFAPHTHAPGVPRAHGHLHLGAVTAPG
jgi:hypothetical protein